MAPRPLGSSHGRRPGPPRRGAQRAAPATRLPASFALLAYLLQPTGVDAGLRVHDGPMQLERAHELLAAPFSFSPTDFRVEGELALTTPADWDYGYCPPHYMGAAIEGKLVIHQNPDIVRCSAEMHARAAGSAGAAIWLMWQESALLFNPKPGSQKFAWIPGDSRNLTSPPAADITQSAAVDLVRMVRTGASVRATVTRSRSAFEKVWEGPYWALWQTIIALELVMTIELALTRLEGFMRQDGGFRWAIPHVVLVLEVGVNVLRMAYAVTDPLWSRGVLPYTLGSLMLTITVAIGVATTALFLSYVISSADSAGVSDEYLSRPGVRRGLSLLAVVVVGFDLTLSIILFVTYDPAVFVLKLVNIGVLLPLVPLVLSVVAVARLNRFLRQSTSYGRLKPVVTTTLALSVLTFAVGLAVPWAAYGPWRQFAVGLLYQLATNTTSYVQVDAFRPVGVRCLRGPLRLMSEWLWHGAQAAVVWVWRRVRPAATPTAEVQPGQYTHGTLGLAPWALRKFAAGSGITSHMTAADVVPVVDGIVGNADVSLAEHFVSSPLDSSRLAAAKATVYVSYAQECSFLRLLDALDEYVRAHALDPAATFFWVDVLCTRQLAMGRDLQLVPPLQRAIGEVVLVLDPWHEPVCLTHGWNLAEVLEAVVNPSVGLRVAMARGDREDLVRTVRTNRRALDHAIKVRAEAVHEEGEASEDGEDLGAYLEAIRARFPGLSGDSAVQTFNRRARLLIIKACSPFSFQM